MTRRYRAACTSEHVPPLRRITSAAVCSRLFISVLSRSLPFHQLQNEGIFLGSSPPAGSRLQKAPTFVPVFSRVTRPVLVWSPIKQPTLVQPVGTGRPFTLTVTSP